MVSDTKLVETKTRRYEVATATTRCQHELLRCQKELCSALQKFKASSLHVVDLSKERDESVAKLEETYSSVS